MINCAAYPDKVAELANVNAQLTALKTKKSELEAFFLLEGDKALKDSKNKSICFTSPNGSVTYTQSQQLTLQAPACLKDILGKVFEDVIKVDTEPTYKVKSSAVERMLIGLYTGDYIKLTPSEVIAQLPCADEAKATLSKKLKGANFDTDVASLVNVGGLSEEDASDYAYMYAEAVVYDTFIRLMKLRGLNVGSSADEMIKSIAVAIAVSDSTKISVK